MKLARFVVAIVVGLAAAAGGCGPTAEPAVEPADAGAQLRAVLDAWKAGQPHAALEARSPPVVFNEPLWRDGATLLEYEMGEVELHGRQGRCTVRLKGKDAAGKEFDRRLGYLIDTRPRVVIGREGLGP
jgi:hypothetical protein